MLEAKQYLKRYLAAERSINTKLDHISKLRALAGKSTAVLGGVHVAGGLPSDKIADIVARIVDMERAVDAEIDDLGEIRRGVLDAIASVDDDRMREVLERKYILGETWEKITVEMHYNYRWVTRLHGLALQKIKLAPKSPI